MSHSVSYAIYAVIGAFAGGVLALRFVPAIFWAALLGGAMSLAAVRVGFVLIKDGAE